MFKSILKKSYIWIGLFIASLIIILFLTMMIFSLKDYKDVNWVHMTTALNNHPGQIVGLDFALSFCLTVMIAIFYYTMWKKKDSKAQIKRANNSEYGNANFLINEKVSNDLKTFEKYFPYENNHVGWIVKSKFDNNQTKYWISDCDKNGHHCLVIGATSSGKTQKTILQSIAYNARINEINKKPSMVIFDPKGEIANQHVGYLKNNGYDVWLFNLRNTFKSNCWNPLFLATKNYFDAKLLDCEINYLNQELKNKKEDLDNEYANNNQEDILLKIAEIDEEINKNLEKRSIVIAKLNETDEIINDIAIALYSDKEAKDKFWQEQAKAGFISVYYLMIESLETKFFENKNYKEIDKQNLVSEYSKINLPSIAISLSNLDELKQYFKFVNEITDLDLQTEYKTRKSYVNGSSVFGNKSENTLGSIVATINVGLEQYKQSTIQNITTTNEIALDKITENEKPVALFIVVPDEKENSYKFATLLIDQMYKANIALAASKPNQKLNRSLMFYLDEFGNIPTIPKFDTMITVSRSRGIYFCIAVQGFDQIDDKYGKNQAKIIIENMLLHIYVSTTDMDTIKYYQQRAGTYTVYKISSSLQNNKEISQGSTNTNLDKKELLNIDDIKNNPSDMLLIFYQNLDVSWVKTDPYWKCKDLQSNKIKYEDIFNNARIFDFKTNYFNLFNLLNNEIKEINEFNEYKQNINKLKNNDLKPSEKNRIIKEIKNNSNFNQLDIIDLEQEIDQTSSSIEINKANFDEIKNNLIDKKENNDLNNHNSDDEIQNLFDKKNNN